MRSESTAIQSHLIPAEAPWSGIVRKGQTVRIVDSEGQQAIDTIFYRASDFAERYSAQDTLRMQGSAYVGVGTKVVSNEGNVMLTVVADTCGRHDTMAGACSCESNTVRFGHDTRNLHACRYNYLHEVSKHGMSKLDIAALEPDPQTQGGLASHAGGRCCCAGGGAAAARS